MMGFVELELNMVIDLLIGVFDLLNVVIDFLKGPEDIERILKMVGMIESVAVVLLGTDSVVIFTLFTIRLGLFSFRFANLL
jgi:hypothetical protein